MAKLDRALKGYSVVMLAAGTVSRMRNIGKSKLKCLLKIGNSAILTFIINKLQSREPRKNKYSCWL